MHLLWVIFCIKCTSKQVFDVDSMLKESQCRWYNVQIPKQIYIKLKHILQENTIVVREMFDDCPELDLASSSQIFSSDSYGFCTSDAFDLELVISKTSMKIKWKNVLHVPENVLN